MSKSKPRLSRVGVLAPAALSACIDASVLAAPAAGAILSTLLKELSKAFMLKNWFHGVMSAQEAEQLLLQKGKHGSYLVRESRTHPGEYVLSVRVRTRVSHVMIRKEQNKYDVGSGEIFDDLTGLIEHCRAYPLTEASGEVLRLRQPVSGARARPRHVPDKPNNKKPAVLTSASVAKDSNQTMEPELENILEELEVTSNQSQEFTEEVVTAPVNDPVEEFDECWFEYAIVKDSDKEIKFTKIEGHRKVNRYKNRYRDVVPYDQTRVPLPRDSYSLDECCTNYINASYVRPQWMFDKMSFQMDSNIQHMTTLHSSDWEDIRIKELQGEASAWMHSVGGAMMQDETAQRQKIQTAAGVVMDKFYIATQGCLSSTKHAFWAMIADNDVRVIAMVTDCVENGKVKCEMYWPAPGETETLFDFQLTNVCEYVHPDYITRELSLVTLGHKRTTIYQYQFSAWPDHNAPPETRGILRYIRDVNERIKTVAQEKTAPKHNILCVHCSAGVGRTGTFIALDMLIDIAKIQKASNSEIDCDIPRVVKLLRKQRPGMVQNKRQYKFIYEVMAQYIDDDAANNTAQYPFFSF